ncbi:MAG TPA: LysE family transporter [Polyangiaceae bacterium]|nr:LysE family transporter [Polyangiaceae bacterium]
MFLAALVGFLSGFIGSVPVAGPIAALIVTRGIEGRFRSGVFIAIGGAIVEALYAFLAFWGFMTYLTRYPIIDPISRGVAAAILFGLSIAMLRKKPSELPATTAPARDSALASFAVGATICALNPTLIATWSGLVMTVSSTKILEKSSSLAYPFAIGVCLGISGWFMALLALIARFKERFSPATLDRVVRAFGGFLLVVAFYFAWRFARYFYE